MNFQLQEIPQERIVQLENNVEVNSRQLDNIVNEIVLPYVRDLDKYVLFVRDLLKDGENPPTTQELEDICMNMSTYIYFASGMAEYLGIRDDIAKAVYKEMYNTSRNSLTKGTVQDKDSIATLHSQEEAIISAAYTRAYKIVKAKVDSAQELLSSAKKVLSHRMQAEQLTNIGGN